MNRNLLGSCYGRFCIKFPQSRMKGERQNEELTLFLNINILFQLLEIQQNYHKKALEEIEKILPKMKDALGNSRYIYVDG